MEVTIHYDINGATGHAPKDQTGEAGTPIVLAEPKIKERFKRWNTMPGGNGVDFFGGRKVYLREILGESITLYALWD
jgi:hypothetical protein